jgi:hypothetical protein
MVAVSIPKSVIRGGNCGFNRIKTGRYQLTRQVVLVLCAVKIGYGNPVDPLGGKISNSLALAADRVRLLTPSLP